MSRSCSDKPATGSRPAKTNGIKPHRDFRSSHHSISPPPDDLDTEFREYDGVLSQHDLVSLTGHGIGREYRW